MDRRFVLAGIAGAGGAAVVARLATGQGGGQAAPAGTASAAKAPPPVVTQAPAPFGKVSAAPVPLGAGGFVTGIDVSTDGRRLVCRTDVCNAYVRERGDAAWRPLFSPSTMRKEDYDPLPAANQKADGIGVAGIRIAPSDKDVIYASYLGYIWRSSDGGKTIARTALGQMYMPSNTGWQRIFNRIIDVHPTNPDHALVGTWVDGAWSTQNGGRSWTQLRVPVSGKSVDDQPGINLVAFDRVSPENVYVFVTGIGLFGSTTGPGGDFQLLRGGPRFCSNLVAAPGGSVYVCEFNGNRGAPLWNYSASAGWTRSAPPREVLVLAVDPGDPAHLFALNADGFPASSRDRGKTWTSIDSRWSPVGGEVAWIGDLRGLFASQAHFDPLDADQLLISTGVGVAKGSGPAGAYRYVDWSAGIEALPAVGAVSVPGGKTFLACWDKPFWRIDDETRYTNTFRYPRPRGHSYTPDLVAQGTYLDYASDDQRFLVGVVGPGSAPGYSADGGDSWNVFDGAPPKGWGYGGCIAASTSRNFVLLPSNNAPGAYTLDGGRTWATVRLDGVNDTDGFANAFYVARKNLTADKTRPGTFSLVYTVIKGPGFGNPLGGLWLTRDGGKTWTQRFKGLLGDPAILNFGQDNRQFWQCKLDYVPGRGGELVYTPHSDQADDRLWWSADDGASWREMHPSIRNVVSFGFGKAAPGQERPMLFFWGKVKGVLGLYASADWCATPPVLLTRFPSPMLPNITWVEGDPNRFGRAYLGTSGAGWVSVQFSG